MRLRRSVRRAVGRRHLDPDRRGGGAVAAVGDRVVEGDQAAVAGSRRDLHASPVGVDRQDGIAAGVLDGLHEQHVAVGVRVVGQHVDVDGPIDTRLRLVVPGDRRAVRTLRVDLVGLHDLGVRIVRVDLGEDLTALFLGVLVIGVVALVREDRSPVLDPIEALLRTGDPRRAGVHVVDPDPAVDEAQPQLRPGAVEGDVLHLGERPFGVGTPLAERRRRRRDGEHAAAVNDRREGRRATQLGDVRRLAAGQRQGEQAAVADGGDDVGAVDARLLEYQRLWSAVRSGDRGVDVVGLVVGGQEQVSVRIGEHGGVGADGGDRDDVVGQLERGARARRPVRLQEHDGAGGLIDQRGMPVGLHGGDRRTFAADDRLDGVQGVERQELGAVDPPHGHRRPVDDQGAAIDGVDRHVVPDVDAAGLPDAHGPVVDEGHRAGRAIVDDDDVGRLVDVVVGARFGGADGSRDLTDGTVDVADVPGVALQEPRPAVVRVGPRALPSLSLQRRDDHGADDEREDREHAAGDATAGVARHVRSPVAARRSRVATTTPCSSAAGPPW